MERHLHDMFEECKDSCTYHVSHLPDIVHGIHWQLVGF